jgi:hypothetical protein
MGLLTNTATIKPAVQECLVGSCKRQLPDRAGQNWTTLWCKLHPEFSLSEHKIG